MNKKKMRLEEKIKDRARCVGREIDPEFRENFCGQTRFHPKTFPCNICDLNSANIPKKLE